MSIRFYKIADKYGCFSNFAHYDFILEGKKWPTSEHYFQAQKFRDTKYCERIRLADSPMKAADLGRSKKYPIREDWEDIKDQIMRKAAFHKFSQNENIKKILLSTGDQVIIEDTISDYYWGCGADKTGKNVLGKILMEIRSELRNVEEE